MWQDTMRAADRRIRRSTQNHHNNENHIRNHLQNQKEEEESCAKLKVFSRRQEIRIAIHIKERHVVCCDNWPWPNRIYVQYDT